MALQHLQAGYLVQKVGGYCIPFLPQAHELATAVSIQNSTISKHADQVAFAVDKLSLWYLWLAVFYSHLAIGAAIIDCAVMVESMAIAMAVEQIMLVFRSTASVMW